MDKSGFKHRMPRSSIEKSSSRIRGLAEAGANGRALSPSEVREVCEALRSQATKVQTHFHSCGV